VVPFRSCRLCGTTISTGRVFHSSDFYYPFWKIIPELSRTARGGALS
jgi:hypothetical protein